MLNKKTIGVFSSILIVISIFLTNITPLFASSNVGEKTVNIFTNIFNEFDDTFILNNTKFEVKENTTVADLLEIIKQNGHFKDYTVEQGVLTRLVTNDDTLLESTPPPTDLTFYIKYNGVPKHENSLDIALKEGDIVEWIYGEEVEEVLVPEVQEPSPPPLSVWDSEWQLNINIATDFLELNKEKSEKYIGVMSFASKAIDSTYINKLLNIARTKAEYDTALELANNVISVTAAGYNAQKLVGMLAEYQDISSEGLETLVRCITAMNIGDYTVVSTSQNKRENLKTAILSFQQEDGGFSATKYGLSDVIATSQALTALSVYSEEAKIARAIKKGLFYLATEYEENDIFGRESKTTAIAEAIIALVSCNSDFSEEKIYSNAEDLWYMLLERQNADGGFCDTVEQSSSIIATEMAIIALTALKKNEYPYLIKQELVQINEPKTPVFNRDFIDSHKLGWLIYVAVFLFIVIVVLVVLFIIKKRRKV